MSEIRPLLSYYMHINCKWRQSLQGALIEGHIHSRTSRGTGRDSFWYQL